MKFMNAFQSNYYRHSKSFSVLIHSANGIETKLKIYLAMAALFLQDQIIHGLAFTVKRTVQV